VDAALIATGRAPFTQGLGLENVCLPNRNIFSNLVQKAFCEGSDSILLLHVPAD